jgi:ABC-2 type transport system permease protein
MYALLKKELHLFFGSITGYFVIALFLILNGLFLWFFDNDLNILNSGFASLSPFFDFTSWLFVLLISSLTMKSFSEEINSGTIEILKTKPLSTLQLVLGKYLAIFIVVIAALLPTAIYVYSIFDLISVSNTVELGIIVGSYIGLLAIASAYISIGLWVSTFSKNPLVVLLSSIFICFGLFYGLHDTTYFSSETNFTLRKLGMYSHFESISRGVLDTKDLLYFIQVTLLFLVLSYTRMAPKKNWKPVFYILIFILVSSFASQRFYKRFDLSKDERYSLATVSKNLLSKIDQPVLVKIYLEGEFPAEFKRLQMETQQLLKELRAVNKNISFVFVNPEKDMQRLLQKGLTPSRLTVKKKGVVSESVIVPWATIQYQNKIENVSLLKESSQTASQEEQLQNAIQNLEFSFIDGLKKIVFPKKKSIAVLAGNGELNDLPLYSFLKALGRHYHLGKFTLDSVSTTPQKTLNQLSTYDLAFVAKPSNAFSEQEKFVLDQYLLQGGRTLWLLDHVVAEMDSMSPKGSSLAFSRNLNLDDFFFRYGIRVHHNIVKDLYAAKISLATGNTGNRTNYENFLWYYHPLVTPASKHAITTNLGVVKLQFPSAIDTLPNRIQKTILLESSSLTKVVETPNFIELKAVNELPDPKIFRQGKKTLGILLEGNFTSAYKDRVPPFEFSSKRETGLPSKMILISDGDIASNQTHKGKPLELGVDKWTQQRYSNKEFLLNAVDYLLDDTGLLQLRSKKVTLPLLNKAKVISEKRFWQFFNFFFPLGIVSLFGVLFFWYRKRIFTS